MIYKLSQLEDGTILINDTVYATITEDNIELSCDEDILTVSELEEMAKELEKMLEATIDKMIEEKGIKNE